MTRIERFMPWAIALVGAVTMVTALRLADSFFSPVTLAIVAGVVLSPISDFWEKIGFPRAFGAMVSMLATLLVTAAVIFVLQPHFARLIDEAPKVMSDINQTITDMRNSMKGLSQMSAELDEALGAEAAPEKSKVAIPDDTSIGPPPPPSTEGAAEVPTLTDALLMAPSIFAQIVIFAGTLFFCSPPGPRFTTGSRGTSPRPDRAAYPSAT